MPRDLQAQFETELERYVEMLITDAPREAITACLREQRNPAPYIVKLMEWAVAAAEASAWFERQGPAWAQPLPLNWREKEHIECGG